MQARLTGCLEIRYSNFDATDIRTDSDVTVVRSTKKPQQGKRQAGLARPLACRQLCRRGIILRVARRSSVRHSIGSIGATRECRSSSDAIG